MDGRLLEILEAFDREVLRFGSDDMFLIVIFFFDNTGPLAGFNCDLSINIMKLQTHDVIAD